MPARKSEETADQPTLEEYGISNPNVEMPMGDTRRTMKTSRATAPRLADDRPQVVRERDRMRAIFEKRGRKS